MQDYGFCLLHLSMKFQDNLSNTSGGVLRTIVLWSDKPYPNPFAFDIEIKDESSYQADGG